MTFNHRYPRSTTRRYGELLGAVDQAEAMSAIAGGDRNNWRDDVGLFGTGSPLATDVDIDVLRSPRDYAAVKRALGRWSVVAANLDRFGRGEGARKYRASNLTGYSVVFRHGPKRPRSRLRTAGRGAPPWGGGRCRGWQARWRARANRARCARVRSGVFGQNLNLRQCAVSQLAAGDDFRHRFLLLSRAPTIKLFLWHMCDHR
jgi:hypothetical protein